MDETSGEPLDFAGSKDTDATAPWLLSVSLGVVIGVSVKVGFELLISKWEELKHGPHVVHRFYGKHNVYARQAFGAIHQQLSVSPIGPTVHTNRTQAVHRNRSLLKINSRRVENAR